MKDNKKTLQVLTILIIVVTIIGGTFAYWSWVSDLSQRTEVTFTVEGSFSCAADGGGNITSNNAPLIPTTCDDTTNAIKREIKVKPTIHINNLSINLDLWLDINSLDSSLADSKNFRYALTTSEDSCSTGVVSSGTFYGKSDNGRISILNKNYSLTQTDTYYLYIWLDKEETDSATMNQNFSFSLGGECQDYDGSPEKPVLDEGMIPVTIDENGDVYTIDKDDPEWYDYENKEWANVVLVSEEEGIANNSHSREYYQTNNNVQVTEADILAYYAWVPRYKYRIPHKKCSDIPEDKRNMYDYPTCYAPYTMSDTEKNKLVTAYKEINGSNDENALLAVNEALQKGEFTYGFGEIISIGSWINKYNNGELSWDPPSVTLTQPTPSAFNGDVILTGLGSEVSIDITFESADATMAKGDAINTYYTHPSFWWDDNSNGVLNEGETIAGIWVGKFESSTTDFSCYVEPNVTNCNNTTQNPKILPNESPLVYQDIGNQFATSRNLTKTDNIYGLSNNVTDGHMMKNRDWGAVLYLSHSKYGINGNIASNNYYDSSAKTGCGFAEVDQDSFSQSSTTCTNQYGTDGLTEYPQSTTGNITGIFDMAGCSYEYVMGNYNNQTGGYFSKMPDSKYYDVYLSSQFNGTSLTNVSLCTLETCGGHALLETDKWYEDDLSLFVEQYNVWLIRGEDHNGDNAFALSNCYGFDPSGAAIVKMSWRSVLVVDD